MHVTTVSAMETIASFSDTYGAIALRRIAPGGTVHGKDATVGINAARRVAGRTAHVAGYGVRQNGSRATA